MWSIINPCLNPLPGIQIVESVYFCWRALARQQPVLYNSKKKAKSVGCKIVDMRSWLCSSYSGIPGACECMWKYRSISSDSPPQLEIKDTINEVKYWCLLLLVKVRIHVFIKVMNSLAKKKDFYVFGCSIMWAILPIREWRCQDIDQVLLHEIILFLNVFSSSEMWGKPSSIRSKLPTAACWSWEEKWGNCEANLLYVESDFGTTDMHRHHRQIIHTILRPLRRDIWSSTQNLSPLS